MLRRGFNNGSRARAACRLPTAASTLARVPAARQVTSRRLFANAGATPPPSSGGGGGGGVAFGVLVGAAVGASGWTGYRYYTDPPFRTRLNDFWASLSSSASTSSPSQPAAAAASPKPSVTREEQQEQQQQEHEGTGAPLLAAQVLLAAAEEATALDAQEEAVVALPDSLVVHHHHQQEEQQQQQQQHEQQHEQEEVGQQVGSAATQSRHGGEGGRAEEEEEEEETAQPAIIAAAAAPLVVEVAVEEVAHIAPEEAKTADVPAAVVALVTESFAASDAHQEAVAAVAHDDHQHHHHEQQQQQQDLAANPAEPAAEQRGHEGEQQQEQHQEQQEQQQHQEQAAAEGATRLQELQAIKEIIAIQAESCERQMREKVERLRQKYEHKMAALRQHMDEVVAEHVDVERQKISDDYQNRLHQQLDTLQHQFVEERQRLYSEMEDVVAGLNARFVALVREEKQLLNEQLEESARLHAHTLAYLQTLVDDAQYRIRHLSEEREWWSWTERLASAVRGLESAALGPEGHLASFQAELDLVRSLAATRPLYKAVAHHIEAQASRGVYSVGRLRERFEQVEKHVRVAAQVPEGGGLLRHAVAPLLAATVSLNPYHAPTPQELLLDSARRHLFDDDLLTALRDMEQLTGLAHELAHDWIEEARTRLVVEQAISVISADVTTLKPPTDL